MKQELFVFSDGSSITANQFSKDTGVTWSQAKKLLSSCCAEVRMIPRQWSNVRWTVEGKEYGCLADAIRETGLSQGCIAYRCRVGKPGYQRLKLDS